jgi:hypothetical protein
MSPEIPDGKPSSSEKSGDSTTTPQIGPAEAVAREKERALFARLLRTPLPIVQDPQPECDPQDRANP